MGKGFLFFIVSTICGLDTLQVKYGSFFFFYQTPYPIITVIEKKTLMSVTLFYFAFSFCQENFAIYMDTN